MNIEKPKKVWFLTGIRSDYDLMYPLIRLMHDSPKFEVGLIVSGAHLSSTFGSSLDQINQDGFRVVDYIESLLDGNSMSSRIKGASLLLNGLVQTLTREPPDLLVVFGDREESIMGALAGAYMNILVAHSGGGDPLMMNVDDWVRQAVTKLANIHFTFSNDAYQRVLKLGEEPWRVFNTGSPALDRLREIPELTKDELSQKLGFDITKDRLVLVIQHVLSVEPQAAHAQMDATMQAIDKLGYLSLVIYPNTDAGSRQIIDVISRYEDSPNIKILRHVPRLEFVNLLRSIDVLVGNSSAGVMEAPFLKIPVVNVGNRQVGRLHAENMIFVDHDIKKIQEAIRKAIDDRSFRQVVSDCASPYGDGHSAAKIMEIIQNIDLSDSKWLVKRMTF